MLRLVTRRMQLLSGPLRVQLLLTLEQRGETCVAELADRFDTTIQNVSKNLCALYREGLLSRRQEGNTVFYSLADYSACRIVEQARASATAHIEELCELIDD